MPSTTPITTDAAASQSKETPRDYRNYTSPLIVVTLLFFMWGFITCMNDILIPKLQEVFTLQLWQAMLIQTAFFGAYFIVSFLYFMMSIIKGDPIQKIGYKNGIIIGLLVAAVGCVLFYPAAVLHSYGFFLMALFVLASGITVLQITANPYVAILGPPETSSSRMNLSQALNSFGTTIAPIIGGYLIFDQVASAQIDTADSVKLPYLGLAGLLLLLALLIKVAKLPRLEGGGKIERGAGATKYPHLVLGIICIFMYVGGEVSIGSALINYIKLPQITGLSESEAKHYLAFFWGGAMVGRFFGAVALSTLKSTGKFMVIGLIALVTFLTVYALYDLNEALIILGLIALNVVVLLLARFIPNRTVGLFALAVIGLLLIGIVAEGTLAMWAIIAIGLFNSIMFPTIFDLAIKGLGRHTSQGSSLLVMAIVGGAIVPPLQGLFADLTGDLQLSFIIPMICYAYIVYYGFVGYKVKEAAV
ncbi:sugar MFS transporter [Pontibacter indicus]|uniref:MFS transporter, FHS family, L-fucose permease n=1 Tax=Pontibacter indicus TaxID=1317125 RepID=A0A1R3WUB5_9BACT|nr:sugar MFS transporter [Pontibacter indicus]SIT81922.1 MFS transporter, FHS family, L-fucose permease [Pontibacter indicus]